MLLNNALPSLSKKYQDALQTYLVEGGEAPLHKAYELGREALAAGIGLLGLVDIHYAASTRQIRGSTPEDLQKLRATGYFLLESLSPFEMMNLGNQESNAALRRLNEILEEEAKRIAHTLHDEAAQLLATAYLDIAEIIRESPPGEIRQRVDRLKQHLDTMREQLRQLSHELRSPILDQLGLLPALKYLSDGFQKRTGIKVRMDVDIEHETRFPQEVEIALYRATQEALSNIARHARAAQVNIRVWDDDHGINCRIVDDGMGFEVVPGGKLRTASGGLGLLGIRERIGVLHGNFSINSTPGSGTELAISVPVKK